MDLPAQSHVNETFPFPRLFSFPPPSAGASSCPKFGATSPRSVTPAPKTTRADSSRLIILISTVCAIVLPSHVPPSFLKSQRAPAGSSPTRGWFLLPEVGQEGAGVLFPTSCSSSRLGDTCGMVPCCKNWPKMGAGAQQRAELKPLPFVLPKDVFHGVLNEPSPFQRPYPLQEALTPPKNCPKPQTPHPQPPNPAPPAI